MAKQFFTNGTGSQQTLTPSQNEKVAIYDTVADAEADLANLEEGQIVATPDTGDELSQPVDSVTSGNMHAVTSNAVAEKLSYDYADFTGGEVIYTIEVPYLANSNNTSMGSIIINARYGYRYMLDYYNFINEPVVATTNERIARLRMLDGGLVSGNYFEPTLKWNVDTTNKKVTFYLKKKDLNTSLSFKVLQEMKGINTVKFGKTTDLTVYTNASYSRAFEYLSPVNSVTSGSMQPVTSEAVNYALAHNYLKRINDNVSLYIKSDIQAFFNSAIIMVCRDGIAYTSMGVVYWQYNDGIKIAWVLDNTTGVIEVTKISTLCTQIKNISGYPIEIFLMNRGDFYFSDTQ